MGEKIEGPIESHRTTIEVQGGVLNRHPIMPRHASLSNSRCKFFQSGRNAGRLFCQISASVFFCRRILFLFISFVHCFFSLTEEIFFRKNDTFKLSYCNPGELRLSYSCQNIVWKFGNLFILIHKFILFFYKFIFQDFELFLPHFRS